MCIDSLSSIFVCESTRADVTLSVGDGRGLMTEYV